MQSARFATELLLGFGHDFGEADRALRLRDVAQLAGEGSPLLVGDRTAGVLVTRLAGKRAEPLVVEVVERGAHDAAVAPNNTITCGCTGAINDGTMSLGSVWVVTCSDTHRTLWRHAGTPDTHAEMVAINSSAQQCGPG